jgi:hypothetical protein
MSDDLTRRMRALIQRMAARYKMGSHDEVIYGICSDARDLMAELSDDPPPDLIEARRIAMDCWQPGAWSDEQWEDRVMDGAEDSDRAVRAALAGITRGRQLALGASTSSTGS